jgi:hypothetical protein
LSEKNRLLKALDTALSTAENFEPVCSFFFIKDGLRDNWILLG